RHAHLAQGEAVGQGGAAHDLTDGVREGGELAQGVGDGGDALVGEGEAVEEGLLHAGRAAAVEVLGVRLDDAGGGGDERVRHRVQGGVLGRAGGGGEHPGGGLGGPCDVLDGGAHVHGHRRGGAGVGDEVGGLEHRRVRHASQGRPDRGQPVGASPAAVAACLGAREQ